MYNFPVGFVDIIANWFLPIYKQKNILHRNSVSKTDSFEPSHWCPGKLTPVQICVHKSNFLSFKNTLGKVSIY